MKYRTNEGILLMQRKYSEEEIRILRQRKIKKVRLRRKVFSLCLIAFLFGLLIGIIVGRISNAQTKSVFNENYKMSAEGSEGNELADSQKLAENDWNLTLVNSTHQIDNDYSPKLQDIENGLTFDCRAAAELENMLSDGQKEGLSLWICSAYRSIEKQTELYNNKVSFYENQGYDYETSCKKALTEVAYPGNSEHNLGLAVDIVSKDYQILDDKQAQTPEAVWLKENCSTYGFILRYPPDKSEITGVIFEPWHFRYVGVEAATEIMNTGISLEEYLEENKN